MRILLLGKNGQVGWELQRALSVLGEVVALDLLGSDGLSSAPLNLQGLAQAVRAVRPQVIVNAVAYTAVEKAESQPELARALNAWAPEVLAREAAALRAWLVHYSTDYVFDGSGSAPWKEGDVTGPLNVYGRTKLEGEQAIAASGCQYLILRTSWAYGTRGDNFVKTMLRLARERDQLQVIDDQIGAPTGADLLADVTAHAIRHVLPPLGHMFLAPSGIYHVTAAGETSWYDYARFVLEAASTAGVQLKANPQAIEPIPTSAYLTPVCRPLNSRLNTTLFQNTFGLCMPPWQQGVTRMLQEIL